MNEYLEKQRHAEEKQVRRLAHRHGLELNRCRDKAGHLEGSYGLSDPTTNGWVFGFAHGSPTTLADCRKYLEQPSAVAEKGAVTR